MTPVSPIQMLWMLVLAYLSTYGLGAAVCLPARVHPRGGFARTGLYCGVGVAILGWAGYVCSLNAWGLAARIIVWAAAALGAVLIAWGRRVPADEPDALSGRVRMVILLAVLLALGFRAAAVWGQVWVDEAGLHCGGLWPDLLYRNATIKEFMTFDGPPEWPWLAGEPLKGSSLLRLSAAAPVLAAAGIEPPHYQFAAVWLMLYGIPVAAGALFAMLRYAGISPMAAAVALVITAFFGNPRWLMEERFAHSPSLIWAGGDVFSFVFPVVYAALGLIFAVIRRFTWAAAALVALMMASMTGHGPWFTMALLGGAIVWLLYTLLRRRDRRAGVAIAFGALLGLVTLRTVCGTGAGGGEGSPLDILAPSPVIRSMAWAFPFLSEPLRPLLSDVSAASAAKLAKFAVTYLCAIGFFILGSLWVRAAFLADWHTWDWGKLRTPAYSFVAAVTLAGLGGTCFLDFSRAAYSYAGYDMLRLLWVPLVFANVALADFALRHRGALNRWWGILIAVVIVGLGGWEYSYYVLLRRALLPPDTVAAGEMQAIGYLNEHASADDIVLIDPLTQTDPAPGVVTHNWGYFSGLCVPAVWLDNRDMAYKFAQNEEWDRRANALRALTPGGAEAFMAAESIDWVYLPPGSPLQGTLIPPGTRAVLQTQTGHLYHWPPEAASD